MPVPPLSVADFAAFQAFADAAPAITPPTATRSWRLADAAPIAADVAWASGRFGVVASNDEKRDALAWWLSIFGSEEWLNMSRRAMRRLADEAVSYTGGGILPLAPIAVRWLNAWCEAMLAAFYADAAVQGRLFDPANPPQPAGPSSGKDDAQAPETPPAPEGIKEERWRVVWPLYAQHVADVQVEHQRPPLIREDLEWHPGAGLVREELRALRRVWWKKICRTIARRR